MYSGFATKVYMLWALHLRVQRPYFFGKIMGKTCCFIGHRKYENEYALKERLFNQVKALIDDGFDTFLFGSRSSFDSLCYYVVSSLKEDHPLKRIYVRAEFPYISEDYRSYLLEYYDVTYFPEKVIDAGKASYVERNAEMIDKSDIVILYCDENASERSGTKIAYKYAKQKKKTIINLFS